jgi:ABC-type transporter Mla subunit MlaD
MELMNEAGARHGAVLERMTAAMEEVGKKTRERTIEVESLKARPSLSMARQIFDQSARDLNEFSAATQSEIPQMSQAHADLLKYTVGAAASSLEISAASRDQSEKALAQLDKFTEIIASTRAQMVEFRANISNLPRVSITFNKAKRRTLQTLDALDTALGEAIIRNTNVRSEINDLLRRQSPAALDTT